MSSPQADTRLIVVYWGFLGRWILRAVFYCLVIFAVGQLLGWENNPVASLRWVMFFWAVQAAFLRTPRQVVYDTHV